jgi:alpha-ribazole phosphatase
MRLHLLRHGEVEGGARYFGRTDVALSERGWQQMQAAVAGGSWDLIVSSPLRRCADFAQALARKLGVHCRLDEDLREMSFGDWEGRAASELLQTDAEPVQRFWSDPSTHAPPGGEPLAELHARVMKACRRIVAAGHEHVLLVTHGGPIRLLYAAQSGIPLAALLRIEVPHAALICIDCLADGSIVRRAGASPASIPKSP